MMFRFPKESGSGVLVLCQYESTLPTTWNEYCFKMTQNTLSFQIL